MSDTIHHSCVHLLALSYKDPLTLPFISSIFTELWFINNCLTYPHVLGLVSGNPSCWPVLVWAWHAWFMSLCWPWPWSSPTSWWFHSWCLSVVGFLKVPQVDDEGWHLLCLLQREGQESCIDTESAHTGFIWKILFRIVFCLFFPPELRTEPRALHLLGKCSTTEPNPQPLFCSVNLLSPYPLPFSLSQLVLSNSSNVMIIVYSCYHEFWMMRLFTHCT